jgi:choline dehydrogenase
MAPTSSTLASTLVLLLGLQTSLARPIKGIERATVQDEYDFIIAGGGTAGLVVANRLSESGKFRVLVLEAGPEPTVVSAYKPLGGNQLLSGSEIDWRFETTPQEGLNDRILTYHRGRTLGGSSVTNGFYYGRGTSTVYDQWVEKGNPGWSWEELWPLFVKVSAPTQLQAFLTRTGNPLQPPRREQGLRQHLQDLGSRSLL